MHLRTENTDPYSLYKSLFEVAYKAVKYQLDKHKLFNYIFLTIEELDASALRAVFKHILSLSDTYVIEWIDTGDISTPSVPESTKKTTDEIHQINFRVFMITMHIVREYKGISYSSPIWKNLENEVEKAVKFVAYSFTFDNDNIDDVLHSMFKAACMSIDESIKRLDLQTFLDLNNDFGLFGLFEKIQAL